jgi:hypothetical protein
MKTLAARSCGAGTCGVSGRARFRKLAVAGHLLSVRSRFQPLKTGVFSAWGEIGAAAIRNLQNMKYVNNDGGFVGHFPPRVLRSGGEMLKGRLNG